MRTEENDDLFHPDRHDTITTLVVSGLTLALMVAIGYAVPDLLTALVH